LITLQWQGRAYQAEENVHAMLKLPN
jgi:hypothetical protein